MVEKRVKAEGVLRACSMVLAGMGAAIVGLDSETKTVFFMKKKATSRHPLILWVFTIFASVAAGYHLLQLCRSLIATWLRKHHPPATDKFLPWLWLLFDQGMAYAMFAVTVAATQGSMVAVIGVKRMQWSKLCNIYGKFCHQISGGLLCGLAVSVTMAAVSFLSARRLFELYSAPPRGELYGSNRWRWNLFYSNFN